jgi:predicted permease
MARGVFGNARVKAMIEKWLRDFKHAARGLLRAPGFTLVVVVTLALPIGANTAIFSVVKDVLLKPLPFPNGDRLVHIGGTAPGTDQPAELGVPDELYFEYKGVQAIEDIGIYGTGSSTTRAEGNVDQLFVTQATPSVFTTLGAQPLIGRLPTDDDNDRVVVISHWMWQKWFNSDPAVLNKSYSFAGQTRAVIGVMKPEFRFPDERVAFWVPIAIRAAQVTPGGFGPRAVARIKPGVTRDALVTELEPLARRVQQRLGGPAPYIKIMEHHHPVVKPLRDQLVGAIATPLWILLGTVGIVFLIACTNVASLFTVRTENRRRDLAVRRALGAGRGDLIRSQVSEAVLLAAAGGTAGALIAWAGVPVLVSAAPAAVSGGFGGAPIPGLADARLDLITLLFTAAISGVAACAFGLLPAIRISAGARLGSLLQSGRGIVGRRTLTRDTLVVVQTACALVLLVGSALLMRSFWRLSNVDAGYSTKDIFTFQIAASRPDLTDRSSMSRFQYTFMDRLKAVPGVESVGYITTLPLDEGAGQQNITTQKIVASGAEAPLVRAAGTGGAYFQTMGIDLLQGRYFERVEEEQGISNVIISKSAAALLFPGEDALGKLVRPATGNPDTWFTVIGVVEDVKIDDLRRQAPEPMVYLPAVSASPAYVMKSTRAEKLEPEVRTIIRDVIPTSPMYRIFTMKRLADNAMAGLSFTTLMVSIAALLALVLGAVGLYGVLSYRVSQRAQEIGVRMALGAEATSVRWMFVWQGARVALIGVVAGAFAAWGLTRYIQTLLFGVERLDVTAFAGMSAVMLAAALVASYIPARRASRVNPVIALRSE